MLFNIIVSVVASIVVLLMGLSVETGLIMFFGSFILCVVCDIYEILKKGGQ